MKREVLLDKEIVGATMCYTEEEQCKYCLDWLCDFCDRVIVLLDNFNKTTENIVLEYKEKFKDKVCIIYSDEPVDERRNNIDGQRKRRYKNRQNYIREQAIKKLHDLNKEKPVDLFLFFDSDEVPTNQLPSLLEEFCNNRQERYMQVGFIEVFNDFKTIVNQIMSPHLRIMKYNAEISAFPYKPRCIYWPFHNERGWKVRHVMIHLCHLFKKWREQREHCDNRDWLTECSRVIWRTDKDVREMTIEEIADYQFGNHRSEPKFPYISMEEYLKSIDNKLN